MASVRTAALRSAIAAAHPALRAWLVLLPPLGAVAGVAARVLLRLPELPGIALNLAAIALAAATALLILVRDGTRRLARDRGELRR